MYLHVNQSNNAEWIKDLQGNKQPNPTQLLVE